MTADDYTAWAQEYWQDTEAVDSRYKELKAEKKNKKMGSIEYIKIEKRIYALWDQKTQCIAIAKELERKAAEIRQKEGR